MAGAQTAPGHVTPRARDHRAAAAVRRARRRAARRRRPLRVRRARREAAARCARWREPFTPLQGLPGWRYAPEAPPLNVRVPSLSEALAHIRAMGGGRSIKSGAGATIILNGSTRSPRRSISRTRTVSTARSSYGRSANLQCMNMPATGAATTYTYYVFPPKNAAAVALVGGGSSVMIPGGRRQLSRRRHDDDVRRDARAVSHVLDAVRSGHGSGVLRRVGDRDAQHHDRTSTTRCRSWSSSARESISTSSDSSDTNVTSDFTLGQHRLHDGVRLEYRRLVRVRHQYDGSATNIKCVYSLPAGTMPAARAVLQQQRYVHGCVRRSRHADRRLEHVDRHELGGGAGSGSLPGTYEISLYDVTQQGRRRHDAGHRSASRLDVDAHAVQRRDGRSRQRLQRQRHLRVRRLGRIKRSSSSTSRSTGGMTAGDDARHVGHRSERTGA